MGFKVMSSNRSLDEDNAMDMLLVDLAFALVAVVFVYTYMSIHL